MAANYFIAGRCDDISFAAAERLGDMMQELLPDALITKFCIRTDEWSDFATNHVQAIIGCAAPSTSPIIWDVSGRLIGGLKEWTDLVFSRYGLELDLSKAELQEVALQNTELAEREKRQVANASRLSGKRALLIVDLQNDLCTGGPIAVPGAEDIIPVINAARQNTAWDMIVLGQRWQPKDHRYFASNNEGAAPYDTVEFKDGSHVVWPDNCVQGDLGAEFHPYLVVESTDVSVQHGTNKTVDSYSAFGDEQGGKWEDTGLRDIMKRADIEHVFVAGLATDFCVAATAKDAAQAGFDTYVLEDACAGMSDAAVASERAELAENGVQWMSSLDLPPKAQAADAAAGESKEEATRRALIIVDVQNDFCEGGTMAVPAAGEIIPVINKLRGQVEWDVVALTQDWHPIDHECFAVNNPGTEEFEEIERPGFGAQVMWPLHCLEGTPGAEFHKDLSRSTSDAVVQKGTVMTVDSYSGFGDNVQGKWERTQLEDVLKAARVTDVYVVGLALDYCVAFTALDAVRLGFATHVVTDASRGITPAATHAVIKELTEAGVKCITSDAV